jgi:hypothetical protein
MINFLIKYFYPYNYSIYYDTFYDIEMLEKKSEYLNIEYNINTHMSYIDPYMEHKYCNIDIISKKPEEQEVKILNYNFDMNEQKTIVDAYKKSRHIDWCKTHSDDKNIIKEKNKIISIKILIAEACYLDVKNNEKDKKILYDEWKKLMNDVLKENNRNDKEKYYYEITNKLSSMRLFSQYENKCYEYIYNSDLQHNLNNSRMKIIEKLKNSNKLFLS